MLHGKVCRASVFPTSSGDSRTLEGSAVFEAKLDTFHLTGGTHAGEKRANFMVAAAQLPPCGLHEAIRKR